MHRINFDFGKGIGVIKIYLTLLWIVAILNRVAVQALVSNGRTPNHINGLWRPSTIPFRRIQRSWESYQYPLMLRRPLRMTVVDDDVEVADRLKMDKIEGRAVLLTVPFAWGTYTPVVRYLYEIQPPVPGFVFSAAYYLLASVTLMTLAEAQKRSNASSRELPAGEVEGSEAIAHGGFPTLGGLELGMYLFLGNGLQVLGLKTVPSDRAGFLVQLTTVMVPLVSACFAGNLMVISMRTWFACAVAFSGVVVMGLDGNELATDGNVWHYLMNATKGDILIILAAFVYTLHVVRLGRYAKETTPLKLAASKATAEAFFSVLLVLVLVSCRGNFDESDRLRAVSQMGTEISSFFESMTTDISSGSLPPSALIGAVIWTGLITCAYTIYAQSFGQQRVSPTEANLIYSVQPIFTALFAWALLGETLGPAGCSGGALIASAVYLVASAPDGSANEEVKMKSDHL